MDIRAILVVAGLNLIGAPGAAAGVITQTLGFGNGSVLLLDRFDPATGVLDEVRVTVDGRLTLSIQSPQICSPCLPQPVFPPIPGLASASVELGSSSPLGGVDATYQWIYTANVFTPLITDLVDFHYGVDFTETTDLFGFALVDATFNELTPTPPDLVAFLPPLLANGTRSDFVSAVPVPLFVTTLAFGTATSGIVPSAATFDLDGTMSIVYIYTSDEADVAEPSALILLGAGWLALLARRRR